MSRHYTHTLADLVDRLSILHLKQAFIPEHKEEYAKEIKDILHDIDLVIFSESKDGATIVIDANTIRAIVVLAQMNLHIWHNESEARKGKKAGSKLVLTHSLNGIRNTAKNKIQERFGGRKDYKVDCLAAEHKSWEVDW